MKFWQTVLLLVVATVGGLTAEPVRTVKLSQLPAALQKAVQTQLGGGKLDEIERNEEEGKVSYTVDFTNAKGEERDFTLTEEGRLLSQEVTLEEVPPAVRNTIKGQVREGQLDNIEKTYEDSEITYEVDMTRTNGTEGSFTVGLDGKLLSVEFRLEETPAPVRKTIEATLAGGKFEGIYHLFEDSGSSYYVELRRGGKVRDFSVAESGKLANVQVMLSELPAPVQKTITEKIDGGRIVRIDKTFELRGGVLPYEVEGQKDGKPFNFSVGPRGRFLGMDE